MVARGFGDYFQDLTTIIYNYYNYNFSNHITPPRVPHTYCRILGPDRWVHPSHMVSMSDFTRMIHLHILYPMVVSGCPVSLVWARPENNHVRLHHLHPM